MKYFTLILFVLCFGCSESGDYQHRDGDIIFHISKSNQSMAIQLPTKSKYSHVGIVFLRDGAPYVVEAVQPVKPTPLRDWVARGERGHFVVKRLRDAERELTPDKIKKMKQIAHAFDGREYDYYFEWTDKRIYCPELVWKVYDRGADIKVGASRTMIDFDLSHPVVQAKVRERFGDNIPLNEKVVSPADIFNSPALETVYEN
jgi:hypothetical protein